MVVNDFMKDFEMIVAGSGKTKKQLANDVGISDTHINRTVRAKHFSDKYVKLMEILGYDIKVTYVKRMKNVEEVVSNS